MEIDKENLENALGGDNQPQMNKETEIGFHNGALNTLIAERNELFKMIQNVENIMGIHIKRLEELGVKVDLGNRQR